MRADPHSGEGESRTVIERPAPGLARGRYPAPEWVVLALGAALLLGVLVYAGARLRGRARR